MAASGLARAGGLLCILVQMVPPGQVPMASNGPISGAKGRVAVRRAPHFLAQLEAACARDMSMMFVCCGCCCLHGLSLIVRRILIWYFFFVAVLGYRYSCRGAGTGPGSSTGTNASALVLALELLQVLFWYWYE